ncbi:MAG TPA: hypothetical protein VGH79_01995 [Gaiellaceae bacterium]|jgi:hypothetical protein
MRRVVILALVSAVAVAVAAVAVAAQSPRALKASILAAGRAQQSVHWVMKAKNPGSLFTFVTDAGSDQGSQTLTLKDGTSSAHLTVELVDETAYVEGDEAGLVFFQGLTDSEAQMYAGQWISIPKDDTDYASTAAGLTLSSSLHTFWPSAHLALVSRKLNGKPVVGVSGTNGKGQNKVNAVVYAPAHGKKLPLELRLTSPSNKHFSNTFVFSNWNETVTVTAPDSSTPISTVRGS